MNRSRSEILDELLVLRSQGGDARALELLIRRWHPRLSRCAARLTGDPEAGQDAAQEAWIAIARGIRRLRDPARFPGWAYRIVAHKSRDWIRREQARRRAMGRLRQEDPRPATEDASRESIRRIRAAIEKLPDEKRVVLTWFYLHEMSVRDIARALSIPEGTVKSRLYHARNALRECLEEP